MRLPPMLGLMIEQVQEDVGDGLRVRHARRRRVTMQTDQRRVVVRAFDGDQPLILRDARSGEFGAPCTLEKNTPMCSRYARSGRSSAAA